MDERTALGRHTATEPDNDRTLLPTEGNLALVEGLRALGVRMYAGVNGGGIMNVTKHLAPYRRPDTDRLPDEGGPSLFTVGEYTAGFTPLGHFLATGEVSACVTTTGAATKLAGSGMSDAVYHSIPAVYVVALNPTSSGGLAPLQDVAQTGTNIVGQLRAEFGESLLVMEKPGDLGHVLRRTAELLAESRPVVIAFRPDALSAQVPAPRTAPRASCAVPERPIDGLAAVSADFRDTCRGKRVVLLATDEAARDSGLPQLTGRLSEAFGAPTLWTVNGAAAVAADNPHGRGHIGFGGNDSARELWDSLGPDDSLVMLGFEPGEYILNLADVPAGTVYHLTDLEQPYGSRDGSFAHRCAGRYVRVKAPLRAGIAALLASGASPARQPVLDGPLNRDPYPPNTREGSVDLAALLEGMHQRWRKPTLLFDDVCLAYKDRQFVTQRSHPALRAFSAYQGSAMGGAFGLAVGAKLADPRLPVFCLSGDGCYRLYAGTMPECAELGIRLFILNNGAYAMVDQVLDQTDAELTAERHHGRLAPCDFVAAAKAHGWQALRMRPDLTDLDDVMDACYRPGTPSLLVEVPIDPGQVLGSNPRIDNLGNDSSS